MCNGIPFKIDMRPDWRMVLEVSVDVESSIQESIMELVVVLTNLHLALEERPLSCNVPSHHREWRKTQQ